MKAAVLATQESITGDDITYHVTLPRCAAFGTEISLHTPSNTASRLEDYNLRDFVVVGELRIISSLLILFWQSIMSSCLDQCIRPKHVTRTYTLVVGRTIALDYPYVCTNHDSKVQYLCIFFNSF